MHRSLEMVLSLELAASPQAWRETAARMLDVDVSRVVEVRPRKRSIDARHAPCVRLVADVWWDEAPPPLDVPVASYPVLCGGHRVVIVGCGPAGMFAALRLIELGVKPVIVERGKDVQARRRDLAHITRRGEVNPDSNYCFGEGGAGTYSDGKLYTRATKRGSVEDVLRTLVAHGAPPDIMLDAHPHIGSNKLPKVVAAMRRSILDAGGEIRFGARVVDFVLCDGEARGVVLASGEEVLGEAVILATGHSARDVFGLLASRGVLLEAKPFAMGVRVEHPQPLIDRIQYRSQAELLPAASYRLACTVQGRGVFSFCMCPGGWIVPSATAQDEVVVNGMSLSRRDSPFANSGLVVAVETEDLLPFSDQGALAGLAYQKSLESMAFRAGGGAQRAPAQRLTDFVAGRSSDSLPESSYHPGSTSAPLHELLPLSLGARLREGARQFGKTMRGWLTEDAVVVGVESRTSSPLRIPRDAVSLQHPQVSGLYPCGEGAGYAGGIVSAALDGVRVAEACAASRLSKK